VSHVLVTGGAGFIGSHLVDRLLERGDRVRVLDSLDPQSHDGVLDYLSPEAELVKGDVRDRETVRQALEGVDRLVHFAAAVGVGQSMYEIVRYTSVNALGAAVVLEEALPARDRLGKVVVASSISIYGEGLYCCRREGMEVAPPARSEDQLAARQWELRCLSCGEELRPAPTPETKTLAPTSIYAVGKRDHEEMFRVWGRAYRVPVTALRFFNVYGPRQSLSNPYTGVAAIFGSRLLNGRAPVVFEDGLQTRDFIHVSDVVRGVVQALEPDVAVDQALNIGTGQAVSVLAVAGALGRGLGVEVEPEIRGEYRAGDIRHCFADISLARAELGFEPRMSFEKGMRELVDWLAEQEARDPVDDATAALQERGLAR